MTSTLYPLPPTSPLMVNADSETGLMPINLPLILGDVYIRMTMSGTMLSMMDAQNPTISLKAGISANPPTDLTVGSSGVAINDGITPVANMAMQWEGNNTYLITVSIFNASPSWSIKIKNNDPANSRRFVWIAANTQAELQHPWIDVDPSLTYSALPNQSLSQTLTIANYGTQAFTINGLNPALGAAFTITPALPITVNPNSSRSLAIGFNAPAAPGTFTLSSNVVIVPIDPQATTIPGHNQQVEITAITQLPANIEAANSLKAKQNQLIRGAFSFLLTQYPSLQFLLNTSRRRSACMRDLSILYPPIIEACQQGSTTVLDRPLKGIKETYAALGIPSSFLKDFYQYIRDNHGLTDAVATAANIYLDYAINLVV
jgi:Phycobilisome protein